jgi:tetratricopeptide (TPR) repeat protein
MVLAIERQKYRSNFEVSQGIGQYNSHDYYAILGAPITADINKIRKSYLQIARLLHPDTFGEDRSSSIKKQASQYLAKLVNPAYTFLMAEKERSEYSTILKLLAKRLIKQGQKITPNAEVAQNLMYSPTLNSYERAVEAIAIQQYQDLDKILERTGQLSELNLVYILHQEGYQLESLSVPVSVELLPNISTANRYTSKIKLIEEYIAQKQWMLAVKELREYLKTDPENSYCQSLLGLAYMHQNLDGMAKVCFQYALKLNPQEAIALQNINKIGIPNPSSQSHQGTNKKKGFFGWLGGS